MNLFYALFMVFFWDIHFFLHFYDPFGLNLHLSVFVCFFDNRQLGVRRRWHEHSVGSFFGTMEHQNPFVHETSSRSIGIEKNLCGQSHECVIVSFSIVIL